MFQSKPLGCMPARIPSEEDRPGLAVPGNSAQERRLAGLQSHWVLPDDRTFQPRAKRSQICERCPVFCTAGVDPNKGYSGIFLHQVIIKLGIIHDLNQKVNFSHKRRHSKYFRLGGLQGVWCCINLVTAGGRQPQARQEQRSVTVWLSIYETGSSCL